MACWICRPSLYSKDESIKDYKISLTEIKEEEVKRQLEIVIDDLETILFG